MVFFENGRGSLGRVGVGALLAQVGLDNIVNLDALVQGVSIKLLFFNYFVQRWLHIFETATHCVVHALPLLYRRKLAIHDRVTGRGRLDETVLSPLPLVVRDDDGNEALAAPGAEFRLSVGLTFLMELH